MRKWKNPLKSAGFLLAAFSVVGIAVWLTYENQQPIRNDDSLCAASVESGQTIVFVDKTDPWNDAQADRLEQHIWWLVSDKMQTEERLSIFTIDGTVQPGVRPLFSFCKPPSGEAANDITRSKDYYNRQYKRQFAEPLQKTLSNVKKANEQDCSPIMEVLMEVLTRREIRDHRGPTRIVLISDLVQNSALYSFYLNAKCVKKPTNSDQRRDTSRIESYIKDRMGEINTKDMSAIVIQMFPEKNPPNLADGTKYTWTQFFRYVGVPVEWERL
jgi:hypothetical protein